MSLLVAMLVGILIGGVGGLVIFRGAADYLFVSFLAGIVGSILGLAAYYLLIVQAGTSSLFSWSATICSIIGAAFCVGVIGLVSLVQIGSKQ
jgi:uncharacterized membrane protein YeaQ/YmgE (transglycosylase-associated protein family)